MSSPYILVSPKKRCPGVLRCSEYLSSDSDGDDIPLSGLVIMRPTLLASSEFRGERNPAPAFRRSTSGSTCSSLRSNEDDDGSDSDDPRLFFAPSMLCKDGQHCSRERLAYLPPDDMPRSGVVSTFPVRRSA